ncbi:MAG TPA: PAS domain-containing sensor histidine kinase [Candidatus Saccharimonadia bacterium]|nr:PAS domain-containing sensor histidine kinase [Candidatus Saccharimonadia bacterium]
MAHVHEVDLTQSNPRQLKVVRLYVYIAWLYLAIFIPIFTFLNRNWLLVVVLLIDVAILARVHTSLTTRAKMDKNTLALAMIAGLTVGAMVTTGGVQQTGLLLIFPYIPFIVFLRSPASARRWLFGMLLYMAGLLVLSFVRAIKTPYDDVTLALTILMYFFTQLLMLAYMHEKTTVDDRLLSGAKQLENVNEKMSEAAQSQKQAIAKAETILQSIGEGVIVFNADGNVETVNPVAERLLGYSEAQLTRGRYVELVRAKDENGVEIPANERPLGQVILTKKPIATSLYYTRRNGKAFPAQISIAPIIMDGTLKGAIEVFRDIYREKEIDKSKTEFVSLASHQLRTPLSTISWYAEMLLAGDAGKITKEQSRYIDEIYRSNQRMTELVGSLLNVSRIELGTFSVDPEPTDLVTLAQDTVKDLEPQIFARRLNFQEYYEPNIPIVNVDPKLMRMVIENLASNAIKYTPEAGKVSLYIKHHAGATQITVKDSGLGIPVRQQDKIFSKLFRADNVKTHDTEGTGLGLYLVKSIVDYSGGKIWFKSAENKGTAFHVSIPDEGMKHKRGTKQLS